MSADVAALLVEQFKADPEIALATKGAVFAYRIPQQTEPPLVLVQVPMTEPIAAPSSEWDSWMVTVDVHANDVQTSRPLAKHIERLLSQFSGAYPQAVVAGIRVESNQSIVDDGWTPTRFRQIVTVDVTARDPEGGSNGDQRI